MEGLHGKIGITQMGGRVAMLDLDTCSSHDGDGFCHHFLLKSLSPITFWNIPSAVVMKLNHHENCVQDF